jgi:hypothetical protein
MAMPEQQRGWFAELNPATKTMILDMFAEFAGSKQQAKDTAETIRMEPQFIEASDPLQAADYLARSAAMLREQAQSVSRRAERFEAIATAMRTQFG